MTLKSPLPLLMLLALILPGCAQTPEVRPTVRICDDGGCSDRPRNAVATETVDQGAEESPGIAKLRQLAQANPKAAYDLALRYYRGDGVRQDSYQALQWMRQAGEQGNRQAQKALGAFYLYGLQEMGADPQEAERWLSMADDGKDKEVKQQLEQARAAKKVEQQEYQARQDRREDRRASIYAGYWNSGYPYYGTWVQTQWRGY